MASFGEILKRERELRSITLREIAAATKINLRHLEALEESRVEDLPGGLFNKGFIRAYSIHVGIDPDEMVNHYLYDVGRREEEDPLEGLRAMLPPEKAGPAARWRQWATLAVILAGGLILFAVLRTARTAPPPSGPAAAAPGPAKPAPTPPAEDADGPVPPRASGPATPAPARDGGAGLLPKEPPAARENFDLEMEQSARVRILCDGMEVLNKALARGERRSFTCAEVHLSVSDGGALRYRLNQAAWTTPARPGEPVTGLRLAPAAPARAGEGAAGDEAPPPGSAPAGGIG